MLLCKKQELRTIDAYLVRQVENAVQSSFLLRNGMVVQSSFHFESFCEERSSQSNHAGMQRPCATQSELSLSCSGALNARSECSIRGPGPRACTSTGCTGSTAAAFCKMARRSPCRDSAKRNDDWTVFSALFCGVTKREKLIDGHLLVFFDI